MFGERRNRNPTPKDDINQAIDRVAEKYVSISFDYVDCETSLIDRRKLPEGTQIWR